MSERELPIGKLRAFLRELPEQTQALLARELEKALIRGDNIPAGEFLLQELRAALATNDTAAGMEAAAKLFFGPIEPFLIDEGFDQKGRIARSAMTPLWDWIGRDLMPADLQTYIAAHARAQGTEVADQLTRAIQDRAAQRLKDALAEADADERARRRLAGQVGTPRAIEDVRTLCGLLKGRDALSLLASRLPPQISNLAEDQLDSTKGLLDSPMGRHPEVFRFGLTLISSRLAMPWQLIRLATKAAESDEPARLSETPYVAAIDIVLDDITTLVKRFQLALKAHDKDRAGSVLKEIHAAVRGLRTEVNLSGESGWKKKITALRAEVSDLVKIQIETIPGRIRKILKPRPSKDIKPGSLPDVSDVVDIERSVEFLAICRSYASEVAANEITLRVYSEVQNFLDTGTSNLLDALRTASDSARPYRMAQVDAAVRFCGKVFGASYATLLAKAAEVAASGDHKARA